MQEKQVPSLGQEDPLEKRIATHSSISWRILWTEEPGGYSPWGHRVLDMTNQLSTAGLPFLQWNFILKMSFFAELVTE